MKIIIDDTNRIHMIDKCKPYGSIIFDLYSNCVSVYQDAESQIVRTKFEAIEESAEFSYEDLIIGLKEVIELLEEVSANGNVV